MSDACGVICGLPPTSLTTLPSPPALRADLGAAYGTAKSGVGVSSMGVMKPDLVMKSIIPVVMAGVLGIYGLIIAVIIANGGMRPPPAPPPLNPTSLRATFGSPSRPLPPPLHRRGGLVPSRRIRSPFVSCALAVAPPAGGVAQYSSFTGYAHLAAGLACGLSGMAAGIAIGIVGDAGVRASAQQAKLYVGMVLILIFAEALGLYGLIVGLILTSKTAPCA